jgi:sugar/nucleoside kinase (ribokinase family)
MKDIYLYGMVLVTNSFLLDGMYPAADTYGEIKEHYMLPGGETGTAAVVLNSLDLSVKMDGTFLGRETYPLLKKFFDSTNVDISSMHFDEKWDGLEDYLIIDKETRTPFGTFAHFYGDKVHRWNVPVEDDIAGVKVAALDAFFGDESELAAKYCVRYGVPYVTIDCPADSYIHRHAAVTVISNEFLRNSGQFDIPRVELMKKYMSGSDGLTIITNGSKPFWYGRRSDGVKVCSMSLACNPSLRIPDDDIKTAVPFKVDVVSTLGAGDTFKAGCTYALFRKMSDDDLVAFASACAATACTRFPIAFNPPTIGEVRNRVKGKSEKVKE